MRIKNKFDKNNLWWTSDTHFFHKNIIEYCNRPYSDVETMNNALITNWNKVVPPDGIIFHLGDFAWTGKIEIIRELINSLNGIIYHIKGNHCYQNKWDRQVIVDIFEGRSMDVASIKVEDDELEEGYSKFFMSHYPHMYWQRDSIHLHGHVHSGTNTRPSELVPDHHARYDVGVDNNEFKPISYHELKVILTKKQMKLK